MSERDCTIGGVRYVARVKSSKFTCRNCAGYARLCLRLPPCTSGARKDEKNVVWVQAKEGGKV